MQFKDELQQGKTEMPPTTLLMDAPATFQPLLPNNDQKHIWHQLIDRPTLQQPLIAFHKGQQQCFCHCLKNGINGQLFYHHTVEHRVEIQGAVDKIELYSK